MGKEKPTKTIEQAKDEIAKENGYNSWAHALASTLTYAELDAMFTLAYHDCNHPSNTEQLPELSDAEIDDFGNNDLSLDNSSEMVAFKKGMIKYREELRKRQPQNDGWISVEDNPLEVNVEYIVAVPYKDKKQGDKLLWWIRHCFIDENSDMYVVGDDDNEIAGWTYDCVTHYRLYPTPPTQKQ